MSTSKISRRTFAALQLTIMTQKFGESDKAKNASGALGKPHLSMSSETQAPQEVQQLRVDRYVNAIAWDLRDHALQH